MKKILLLLTVLFVAIATFAQDPFSAPLPVHPDLKTGKLPNGITYYVLKNSKPASMADFYIVHHVGAMQEEDNQNGLAHFLEHMAFNGTKHFPDKALLNYLESIGVRFGSNVNAYTSQEETVYMLSDVPTVRPSIIDSALLVLNDWSHYISLEGEEIDKERGVILEEMRTGMSAPRRIFNKQAPVVFNKTKYADRLIIGTENILKNFTYDEIRDFYHDWYRTDNQSIIAVGDFDPDVVVAKIKEMFSQIPAVENPKPKVVVPIPLYAEDIVTIATDPELTATTASIYIPREMIPIAVRNSVGALSLQTITSLAETIINNRFSDQTKKADAPFLNAYAGTTDRTESSSIAVVGVVTAEKELPAGIKAATKELNRVRKYGFTQSELDRAKAETIAILDNELQNAASRSNAQYVQDFIANVLRNENMMSVQQYVDFVKPIIENVTLDQVNSVIGLMFPENKAAILVASPEKEGIVPDSAAVLAAYKAGLNEPVEQLAEETIDRPLLAKMPKKGKIKKETTDLYGNTVWTLSNGAKVVIKTTDFDKNDIGLRFVKEGGMSLVDDNNVFTATMLGLYLNNNGVADFSSTDLRKLLSGKKVSTQTSITKDNFSVSGSSAVKDIETMLQLVYLELTAPRFDKEDYEVMMKQLDSHLKNIELNPMSALNDSLQVSLNVPSERIVTNQYTKDNYRKVSLEDMAMQYNEFLEKGVAGGIFYFTGNVSKETLRPLVETYLASLPKGTPTSYNRRTDLTRLGKYENVFKRQMENPKVTVVSSFVATDVPFTTFNMVAADALEFIMKNRYLEIIREEKGASYGVHVSIDLNKRRERAEMMSFFDTNDNVADEMAQIIVDELQRVAKEGVKIEDLQKAKESFLKNFVKNQKENSAWLNWNRAYHEDEVDVLGAYEKAVNDLTMEDIKALASKFVDGNNYVKVMMRPE